MVYLLHILFFFFFNDTATTEIYTLSLHDALPISPETRPFWLISPTILPSLTTASLLTPNFTIMEIASPTFAECSIVFIGDRSEEHTSELQSRSDLVCRLLLEKKNTQIKF